MCSNQVLCETQITVVIFIDKLIKKTFCMVKILHYKSSQKLKYLNIVLLFDGFLDLYKSLQPLLYLENFEIGVNTLIFSLQLLEDVILLNKINLGKHSFYIIICLPTFSKLNSLYVFKNTYTSLFLRNS